MKLSEAILLSIGAVKEIRSNFFIPDGPCGCALGTALYSTGLRKRLPGEYTNGTQYFREIERLWPWTKAVIGDGSRTIAEEISYRHVNGQSRESLAAWITTIEPPDSPTPAPVTQEEVREANAVS